MTELRVVLCTVPSPEEGRRIANGLLESRLAACVNIVPGLTSLYWWQGKREEETESLLIIKTVESEYPALEKRTLELHPYTTPEIVALPAAAVYEGYLKWALSECGPV